jgi:hypothetical protein
MRHRDVSPGVVCITGDKCRIYGSDRDSRNPIWLQACFGEGLIDPGLVSAQGTATLQEQCDAFEPRTYGSWMAHAAPSKSFACMGGGSSALGMQGHRRDQCSSKALLAGWCSHEASSQAPRASLLRAFAHQHRSTLFRALTIFHTSCAVRDGFNARPRQRPPLEPLSARARWKRTR